MSDKYKYGKIYTIRCKNDDTLISVGSISYLKKKRRYSYICRFNYTYVCR